jgi:membrane associated rhomboid family serine protease
VLPELTASWRLIRYDARGFGRSPAPAVKFSLLADLITVLDHFGLDRVAIVGCRQGGGSALGLAVEHPARVSALVLLCPGVPGYRWPEQPDELQRAQGGLPPGQWWRLITPLLVQTVGWYQVAANLVTLAVIGAVAEWLLGRWRWLVLSAAGTVGGQVAAYAWRQPGGGDSIAIAGLAGGTAIALLAGWPYGRSPRAATQVVLYYIAALGGWALTLSPYYGLIAAALACAATAAFVNAPPRPWRPAAERLALAATIPGAALIAVIRQDPHGAALIAGMLAMTAMVAGRKPGTGGPGKDGNRERIAIRNWLLSSDCDPF